MTVAGTFDAPMRSVRAHDAPILFHDLESQKNRLRDRIRARLDAVLDHGGFIHGPEVQEIERQLCDRVGATDVVACANGTDALVIALMAKQISPGDGVIVPGLTYNATANAVMLAGGVPIFADVDETSQTLSPIDFERKIESARRSGLNVRAAIPVDLFGMPADYARIEQIAGDHDVALVSDAAQSLGASLKGVAAGNLCDVTTTSFFPSKTLGCYGDGGALFARRKEEADLWRSVIWHGTTCPMRISMRVGMNSRLDTMQAAILLAKLEIFDEEVASRRRIASYYSNRLSAYARPQTGPDGARSCYAAYNLTVSKRDAIRARLREAGVPAMVFYASPLHAMPAFSEFAPTGGLPVSERLSRCNLALPVHPYLTERELEYICDAFERAAKAEGVYAREDEPIAQLSLV